VLNGGAEGSEGRQQRVRAGGRVERGGRVSGDGEKEARSGARVTVVSGVA
jgi:hypothetical protein